MLFDLLIDEGDDWIDYHGPVVFPSNAQIFRFGGDEFSVILSMNPDDRADGYISILEYIIKSRQKKDLVMLHSLLRRYSLLQHSQHRIQRFCRLRCGRYEAPA